MDSRYLWLVPAVALGPSSAYVHAAQYMTLEQAQALIFAKADEFVSSPVTLSRDQMERIQKEAGVKVRSPQQQVWLARAKGELLGWFFLDQVIGKHEYITYAAGINADGTFRQLQIIEYREAYGYQVRELKWRDQFVGKTAGDELELGKDIRNISGATLSCRHMTEGVKRLLVTAQVALGASN